MILCKEQPTRISTAQYEITHDNLNFAYFEKFEGHHGRTSHRKKWTQENYTAFKE